MASAARLLYKRSTKQSHSVTLELETGCVWTESRQMKLCVELQSLSLFFQAYTWNSLRSTDTSASTEQPYYLFIKAFLLTSNRGITEVKPEVME